MIVKENAIKWYYKKLKSYPDLKNPLSYNDKIQWLKIYDQDPNHVICCDKLKVKDWVEERVSGIVISNTESYPAVWKTTHDSGGITFVNSADDIKSAEKKLKKRLKKTYGFQKGEWAYSLVKPAIIKEKRINNGDVDYKFHCCNGEVKWLQMIWDRYTDVKESIMCSNGNVLDLHLDHEMKHTPQKYFCTDQEFKELKRVAEILSKEWKYVRVDLYLSKGQVWFGELTFWPKSGCYKTKDVNIFGSMINFDLTATKPPVIE